MITISKLNRSFGQFKAINNLELEVLESGLYIFVGANGSGKSTLFNLIAGLIIPDYGQINVNGMAAPDQIRTITGIAAEPFITEPTLTVSEIFKIGRQIKKVKNAEVEKWLAFWELDTVKNKPFKNLSTGMKKRLSIALSLLGNPKYIIWDEPFNGLDPLGIDLLNQLCEKLISEGKYIFLSTHLLNEITFPFAIYFVMKEGKITGTINGGSDNSQQQIINMLKEN